MKVFISWSGERSKTIAVALQEWLPFVLQYCEPWVSAHDIDAGMRWADQLSSQLDDCDIGVLVLTPENQKAPWVLFEAGAISKSVGQSKLIPLLIDLTPADVESPLSQFQSVTADRKGVENLCLSINREATPVFPEDKIRLLVQRMWSDFGEKLQDAEKLINEDLPVQPIRSDRDVMGEVLELVRGIARNTPRHIYDYTESIKLEFDFSVFFTEDEEKVSYVFPGATTISDFLDGVYFLLNDHCRVAPYSYGSEWILKNNRTGEVFDEIGTEYLLSKGQVRDDKPINMLDLEWGDNISVFKP